MFNNSLIIFKYPMKKILLSAALALLTWCTSEAQSPYTLSGTSYTQSFDNLAGGLPLGWRVDTMAKPSGGLGNNAISKFSASPATWAGSTSRGFKNVASADGLISTSTTTDQGNSTDRALAVRQVSATGWDKHDSLASVSFNIANTSGLSGFNLSFKIMSLHTGAKRYNNWCVQYGLGATPTAFTTVTTTPGTIVMDSNFTTTNVTVNFGSSLDNQSQPVWIRFMPKDTTMGSGSRPLVGLDDVNLTWTGTAVNNTPQVVSYTPASGATNVPTSTTSLSIVFDKNMTIGTGNVTLKNLTDATQQTIAASSCTASGTTVTIPGVTLVIAKQYAVLYDSTCFKYNTYSCLGVYDTLQWEFSTPPPVIAPVTSLNETFGNCSTIALDLFTQSSVNGTQIWRCSSFGHSDSFSVYMNGGSATESFDNEDWLLSPQINVSAMTNPYLHFWTKRRFSGTNTKEVFVSNNYSGDVSTATWGTAVVPNMSTLDSNNWNHITNTNLNSFKSTPFTIAFKYVSTANTPSNAEEWTIDDVNITDGPLSVREVGLSGVDMYIHKQNDQTQLILHSTTGGSFQLRLTDVSGNVIARQIVTIHEGKNVVELNTNELQSGMYFVELTNGEAKGVVKFIQ